MYQRPTDDQIMRALCCGEKCKPGPNTGLCHRWDFMEETKRVRALLNRLSDEADRLRLPQHKPEVSLTQPDAELASTASDPE